MIYFKGITNSGIFARFYYSAFVLSHSLLTKLVSIPKNLLSVFYSKMRVNLWDNLTSIYFRHGDHDQVGGWLSLFLQCSSLHVRSFEWHPWAVWSLVLGCRLTLCSRWTTHRVDGLIVFWVGHLRHCGLCHLLLGLCSHFCDLRQASSTVVEEEHRFHQRAIKPGAGDKLRSWCLECPLTNC